MKILIRKVKGRKRYTLNNVNRQKITSRMLEDEADKDVVDGYGDGIDTHGSHGGA